MKLAFKIERKVAMNFELSDRFVLYDDCKALVKYAPGMVKYLSKVQLAYKKS